MGEIELEHFIAAPKKRFRTHLQLFNNIVVIWLIPGFEADLLRSLLVESDDEIAIVLAFYGAVNVINPKLCKLLCDAKTKKKEIVIMSQCSKGHLDIASEIESDKDAQFKQLEAISMNAHDMTIESVVTKLSHLMGIGLRGKELKQQFETNLRGEMTPLNE